MKIIIQIRINRLPNSYLPLNHNKQILNLSSNNNNNNYSNSHCKKTIHISPHKIKIMIFLISFLHSRNSQQKKILLNSQSLPYLRKVNQI